MELERFENYPWGRVAFKVLMYSVKGRDIWGCYTINEFAQALQVWVYTALPELGANYGNPLPNNPSPPILDYKGHKGRRQFKEAILSQNMCALFIVYEMDLWTKERVNGTNVGRKSLPEDKGPDVPADASFAKDKAAEPSLVLLDKNQSSVSDLQKEDARYLEKRDAALALCRGKIIIITPFDKKPRTSRTWWYQILRTSLEWLEDCHIDAWINVLRKRYDANPQHFRSERMCFLDHLFTQQWRFNFKDFKDSEPDQNGLGRRLPGLGRDIDDIYVPVNYTDTHWIAMWISIPKRHIVIFDSIFSSISPEELDVVMENFLYIVPYLLVECAFSDEQHAQNSLKPFTYERPTNIPLARAGDCGVYAIKYIECHALGIAFSKKDFAKPNGKAMRDKMAVNIFQELPDAHEFENKDNYANLGAYEG
uniref:Ubiquitin-like protease family profile domain-containing protein n=1 Tax=Brassica oleracea var. oleracea TaxID=109376 RepID=A0A0D3A5U7_BRAOL